ncbi:Protein kinase-like protein [Metarhizium robertsii ARSEF 23]|uniref:Protein kinase-like protein n=1 Tax=Metarhizium robertsii (strain ARSEF 23 / ATCC MYA-3075) TaxID=655844 RepID=A0A0B2XEH5_METRA|nr:Protein kinase-like protein [Metarhizium robertsii ARSEF 23]KHO11115.1 Protein kinase-like protein [Metarhizium robertsii ARSEF 23]
MAATTSPTLAPTTTFAGRLHLHRQLVLHLGHVQLDPPSHRVSRTEQAQRVDCRPLRKCMPRPTFTPLPRDTSDSGRRLFCLSGESHVPPSTSPLAST